MSSFASGALGASSDPELEGETSISSFDEVEFGAARNSARPASALADDGLRVAVSRVTAGLDAGNHVLADDNAILVDVRHDLTREELEASVDRVDGRIYQRISNVYAEVFVPATAMRAFQDSPGIASVHLPLTPVNVASADPVPLVGSVASESVGKANATAWHTAGFRGNGVDVGVIDSFDTSVWSQAAASDNVQAPTSVFCRIGGAACNLWTITPGELHGTAVGEIIFDMAPQASLHLANAFTPGDYISAIDHFASVGVSVVNHSRTWPFDGPGDGTGPAADIVDYAASKGILWVNAAGNYGDGAYWRGTWSDPDGDDWLNFSGDDEAFGFFCDPGLGLRWDDWPAAGRTDYDVYIWDEIDDFGDPGLIKASSIDFQTAGADPVEYYGTSLLSAGCAPGGDVDYLGIQLWDPGDSAVGDTLELLVASLGEYSTVSRSAAIPFGDSSNPASLSIGAVDPPNGVTAALYSSRGPTNDGRVKPDLSAASGVGSFSYGVFPGTSAAAPAVAGAAALLESAGVVNSPAQAASYLENTARVDRGVGGTDNVYGTGELRLPAPPPPPSNLADVVGLVDPLTGVWNLRASNGVVTGFFYGNPGDYPFVGDWDCDGVDTPGLYRQSDGFVYLRNSNSQGVADIRFFFGNPGDIPLAGDFDDDGCDTVSIYRPSEARIFVINELGGNDGGLGAADFSYLFGNPGDKPFVGDFDGDGIDTIGLHRESTGFVYFRQTHTQGIANAEFFFGDPGDRLVAGDWGIVDGTDTPGLFRPSTTTFYFRHTNSQGNADSQFQWGSPTWLPIAGTFGALPGTGPGIGCPVFPPDNIWNTRVDTLPVHAMSTQYVARIGPTSNVHADFGSGVWPPGSTSPIGIPYVAVGPGQPDVGIEFTSWPGESDPGPYPVPANAPIEGGPAASGDRHVIVFDPADCMLYEMFYAFPNGDGTWRAANGAKYDLRSNTLRPAGWTSADAAGLPIYAGLVRYSEVAAGVIPHAIRFTAPQTQSAYTWPARHEASNITDPSYPPMGQRFRLKASFDTSGFSYQARVILEAMKAYGIILADNGSPWYISGAPDPRWSNDVLHQLDVVEGSDFEAVDVSSLMVDPNSGRVAL